MARKPRARYLQVKSWWDFQHYPDRVEAGWTPPWIKTYTSLLNDYEYNNLSEVDRGRLHRIWLLAAQLDNKIPWDEKFIRTAIHASGSFSLTPFIERGMLLEWTENATVRPPSKRRKRVNQAKSSLDAVYTESMPEQSRAEQKREEALHALDARLNDFDERDLEVDTILGYCNNVRPDSRDTLQGLARRVPLASVVKVRDSVKKKRGCGVGYAVNALRSEAEEVQAA